jgi:RIO-like serine/threonine protein kinase
MPDDARTAAPTPEPRPVGGERNATKARVYREERDGRRVAVKTAAGAGLVARWLLRREARIFGSLPPLRCVPRVLEARPDRVVTEWVDGTELFDLRLDGFTPEQAAALDAAVAELHAAGFAHGDLGRHDVIFRPDGGVSLIDFATGVGPGTPPLLWRLLLPLWRRTDRGRVRRLVARYRKIHDERGARRRVTPGR